MDRTNSGSGRGAHRSLLVTLRTVELCRSSESTQAARTTTEVVVGGYSCGLTAGPRLNGPQRRGLARVQAARRCSGPCAAADRTSPETDDPPSGSQSLKRAHEKADARALRIHPRTFEERDEEFTDRLNPRDTSPHRGEVSGLQDPAAQTPLHEKAQRSRALRGLHPQALGAGLLQCYSCSRSSQRCSETRSRGAKGRLARG